MVEGVPLTGDVLSPEEYLRHRSEILESAGASLVAESIAITNLEALEQSNPTMTKTFQRNISEQL